MLKCLLDIDGVIANFVKGCCDFYFKPDPYLHEENFGQWDIVKLFKMEESTFWNPLGKDFWANLEPMPDYLETIKIVEDHFGIENVCLLSTPSAHEDCVAGKLRWIKKYLPKYQRRYLFGPMKEFCSNPYHVLIDDYDKNVSKFVRHKGLAFLVPRPWNARCMETNNAMAMLKDFLDAC